MPKRIESKTSRTAEFTCMVRCLSYLESRPQYKTDDFVSFIIMNSMVKFLAKFSLARKRMIGGIPTGMYEYVIARTKYIDQEVKETLKNGVEQILILGAGFDSRGIRFADQTHHTKVFELDAPVTQNAKLERLKQKEIRIPDNLIFVPIDFDKQAIPDRLTDCGFEKGKKSLIIMEGLTMYLQPESIHSLFQVIQEFTGAGSRIVFDFIYKSVLNHENLYSGEKELIESTSKNGERFCFGLEKGDVQGFLHQYGFEVADLSDSILLENKYFMDDQGKPVAKVNGTHCITTAVRIT